VDRTFEAVEDVRLPCRDYLEGQMVIVSADFAFSHARISSVTRRKNVRGILAYGTAALSLTAP
jgi:hypothetical protein